MTPVAGRGRARSRSRSIVVVAALAPLVVSDFFRLGDPHQGAVARRRGREPHLPVGLRRHGVARARSGSTASPGMTFANLVLADGGSAAAWAPWLAAIAALVVATRVGLGFGAIAARSVGIYFLMITLAFSVLVYYFFSQVTQLSGFGGVNNLDLPGLVGEPGAGPGAALLHDARRRGARVRSGCATSRARRSGWRCRACATSRRACARWASTSRATASSRSAWRRSSRPSPACCRSGTTAASRRGRSTWRRRSTS